MTSKPKTFAKKVGARLQARREPSDAELSAMSDAELAAIIDGVPYRSGVKTLSGADIRAMSDEELSAIAYGTPMAK